MNTSYEEKFFMLLRIAFLEIRMSAHEDDCKKAGKIADIFHNMPGEALHSIRIGLPLHFADNAVRRQQFSSCASPANPKHQEHCQTEVVPPGGEQRC